MPNFYICPKCNVSCSEAICEKCVIERTCSSTERLSALQQEIAALKEQIQNIFVQPQCSDREKELCDSVAVLESRVRWTKRRVRDLNSRVNDARDSVSSHRVHVEELRLRNESRLRKLSPKPEFAIPFLTYMSDHHKFDRSLSALHPFRKLRSVSASLAEERRVACSALVLMMKFRPVKVHGDGGNSSMDQSVSPSTNELIADLSPIEGEHDKLLGPKEVSWLVAQMSAHLVICATHVLDTPLPFPIVFGSLVSARCLHVPRSALDNGCPPYPRILHPNKRVLFPVSIAADDPGESAKQLLNENLRYLASIACHSPITPVSIDPVQLLSVIFANCTTQLGREIHLPFPRSVPSSPSLSASYSPSSSYRKSVIEQSVTEGGEWTLLDQL